MCPKQRNKSIHLLVSNDIYYTKVICIAKKCKHSINIAGQLNRCKLDNCICCTYPQDKCPNFEEKVFGKMKK